MTVTPLIRHYLSVKEQYPDSLVLYQVGDFYELFFDDAKTASHVLAIALTARGSAYDKPIPLCGVPVHTLDHHLAKLVTAGFRVVIVEQLTAPQPGKLVERGVTRVLTPGTLVDSVFLTSNRASYCVALCAMEQSVAIVLIELLTGEVGLLLCDRRDDRLIEAELARYAPDEIIIPQEMRDPLYERVERQGYIVTRVLDDMHDTGFTQWTSSWSDTITALLERSIALRSAVRCLYRYLAHHQPEAITACTKATILAPESFLIMDRATQENLEIAECARLLDETKTAMGARLLRKWCATPLRDSALIEKRHAAVERGIVMPMLRDELAIMLRRLGDLERVVGRIALRRAQPDDYRIVHTALEVLPALDQTIRELFGESALNRESAALVSLRELLAQALSPEVGTSALIASGHDAELDRLRRLVETGVDEILALEQQEQRITTIPSLKIRYHQTYGYAIEVPKSQAILVPDRYHKLQELANRWRFTTDELRALEYDMDRTKTAADAREKDLFESLALAVYQQRGLLRECAARCAEYDVLQSLAQVAHTQGYVKPLFHASRDIVIQEGRHPLVAAQTRHAFVPNDTQLTDEQSLLIITGPNMGGKSTYLKQVALIIIMAQMGSFVPARSAQLPIVDRIFTRIGASDRLSEGKSTFFVEMEETALICKHATENSLVILDEVGRGTSTYDGLAIAQAVVEYIHDSVRARCLFATHYHELADRVISGRGIAPYHAASRETAEGIVLLHTIVPGIARGSYGIEVARTANLPTQIIARAQEVLSMQSTHGEKTAVSMQPFKSEREHPILTELRYMICDDITPRQAHDILCRMVLQIRGTDQRFQEVPDNMHRYPEMVE